MPDTPLTPAPPPHEISVLRVAVAGVILSLIGAALSAVWWRDAVTTLLASVLVGSAIALWGWTRERSGAKKGSSPKKF